MLITFKSPAGGDVIMFGNNASQLLSVLDKNPAAAQGIFTVEQIPAAIATLEAAIAADKAQHNQADEDDETHQEAGRSGMAAPVSLAQRAWPLLDLLRLAQRDGKPVTWGV
ncbi:MAG: DUF1840 domain-containing protein [Rhodocyclaceae bacterium]|jgi:hypothetical protein|nr:DUF1840 domain-containing protein [Rhodocyclaceae bacterium]